MFAKLRMFFNNQINIKSEVRALAQGSSGNLATAKVPTPALHFEGADRVRVFEQKAFFVCLPGTSAKRLVRGVKTPLFLSLSR